MLHANELTVTVGVKERKVFLQNGFYDNGSPTSYMHRHNYAEVHLISGEGGVFAVDDKEYFMGDGCVILIPEGAYHGCVRLNGNTKHTAFQIAIDVDEPRLFYVNVELIAEFFKEIENCRISGDHRMVAAFISLVCGYFSPSIEAKKITDIGFLISEFFSNSYGADVSLEDLAAVLHLSTRQTERLVKEHTGRSFREELTFTRMVIADRLMRISDRPLCQVAQYVGYRSYAGFWKAYRKYKYSMNGENRNNESNK